MSKRNEFIKKLHDNVGFKNATQLARNDAERKTVIDVTERFVNSFIDVLLPLLEKAERDPEFSDQLAKAMNEGHNVLTVEDPMTSGSNNG